MVSKELPSGEETNKDQVLKEPKKSAGVAETWSDSHLNYDSEEGSLEQDKALETHKIPDSCGRWKLLSPNGGLKKLILRIGTAVSPSQGEKVFCHYSGFLRSSGEMFDSSRERGEEFSFEIGNGSVIKGWDIGIASMLVGERAILRCTAEYAYGEKGSPPKIPENATLDFVVQLNEIEQYKAVWGTKDADESIWKKTIKEVEGWDTAEDLWDVTVTYTGREDDENGRIWCSGKDEKFKIPFDLEFESKGVIPDYEQPRGFFVCLRETKIGEVNFFKLQSNDFYTFGTAGSEKFKIKPNTDLFYEMTVSHLKRFNTKSWQLKDVEKVPKALELKDIANDYFRHGKLAVAKQIYGEVLNITTNIKDNNDEKEKINEISVTCYSNTALVETQLNNISEASEQIEKGLAIDPKHEKLRYRQALLTFKRGDFSSTDELLNELLKEFPESKAIKLLASKNARAIKASKKTARKLARKMFGSSAAKRLNEECVSVAAAETEKEKGDKTKGEVTEISDSDGLKAELKAKKDEDAGASKDKDL